MYNKIIGFCWEIKYGFLKNNLKLLNADSKMDLEQEHEISTKLQHLIIARVNIALCCNAMLTRANQL